MVWFYDHKLLFDLMDRKAAAEANAEADEEEELEPPEVALSFVC